MLAQMSDQRTVYNAKPRIYYYGTWQCGCGKVKGHYV